VNDAPPLLEAENLALEFEIARTGEIFVAIRDLTLRVARGSFTVVVGPSGCGKTTLLRAIAGLIPYARGRLAIAGRPVSGPGDDRAFVFQSPALMPWRDVLGNVIYGLELRRVPRETARARATAMIELVGLARFAQHYPHELSGGMRQRVNLARALAVDPAILLLDEPFSALDAQTRETMQNELLRIWDETHKTAIFITHDIAEAVFLADTVAVLSSGPASTLLDEIAVGLPRPRTALTRRDPAFFALVDRVSARIGRSEAGG
jgi:NitT/TauT family transport system ATP-binding protein